MVQVLMLDSKIQDQTQKFDQISLQKRKNSCNHMQMFTTRILNPHDVQIFGILFYRIS